MRSEIGQTSSFEERGCICNLHIVQKSVVITVTRKDDLSKTESVTHELFNPYALYGYDYEDGKAIEAILDKLLDRYGDPKEEDSNGEE